MRPADIVGAIANEADIPGRSIGAISIHNRFSMVDVPAQYLRQILERMQGATIRSQDTNIRVTTPNENPPFAEKEPFKPRLKRTFPKRNKKGYRQ